MPEQKKPILLDLPNEIVTERMIIRPPHPGDGAGAHEAIMESLENLKPWMPWATPDATVEETEANTRQAIAKWQTREDLRLMLVSRSDGSHLGGSGLHRIDWDVPCFEIGYWIRTSAQGKGYVTEAVNAITEFAFGTLGAERIEIRCDALNVRSAAVAKRCGYPLEATLRNQARSHTGDLRDTLLFAMIRADWLARQGG